MPRGRWLVCVAVLAAVAVAALSGSEAAASGVDCMGCVGTYSGNWTATITTSSPQGTSTSTLKLDWTETLQQVQGGYSFWQLTSASGSIQFTNTGDSSDNCDATLSPNPAIASNVTQFAPEVLQGASLTVSAEPPTYWSGQATSTPEPLLSSDAIDPGCDFTNNTAYANGLWTTFTGSDCHYAAVGGGEAMTFPLDATSTVYDNCSAQGSDAYGDTGTATLTSQLTLTPPGLCPPPPSLRHAIRTPGGPAAPVARSASGGLLTATVTGTPRGFTGALTVLAIAAEDGEVVDAAGLGSQSTRTAFRLPSNRYAVLANAVSTARRHEVTGIGALVNVHSQGSAKSTVALGRLGAASDTPATAPSAGAAAAAGPVVTVGDVTVTLPNGQSVALGDWSLYELFPTWHDQDGITFVETGKPFVDFAHREQQLSDDHRLAQPYQYHPLTPGFTLTGQGRIDRKRNMTITLVLRRSCDGQAIGQVTITQRLGGKFINLRYLADMFDTAEKALRALQPPTSNQGCGCA